MNTIHCPSCGKPAPTDQQFCRTCGMSLDSVSKLVAAHSGDISTDEQALSRAEAERRITRAMFTWMGWGILIAGIGIAMLVVNKSFDLGRWFLNCASFLLLGGTGIAVFGFFKAMRDGINLPGKVPTQSVAHGEPTKALPGGHGAPLPSITERTTQLIASPDERTKQER
jgi:predicted nucleic acid-binding Zn ribbon protein